MESPAKHLKKMIHNKLKGRNTEYPSSNELYQVYEALSDGLLLLVCHVIAQRK